jgi:flagellar hook-associated protein 1
MSSLNASLAIALSSLGAEQGALEATSNNVANVNTPGYSREVPILATSDPITIASLTYGSGVTLKTIESIRDSILESQIQQETQTQGQLGALVSALKQTQSSFTSTAGDIGTAISKFFDSINQLSTSPADVSLRQNVLTTAGNVASAFNVASNNLMSQRLGLDQNVDQTVGQINQLTDQIARLNSQISNLENVGENAGTFVDQRTQLIDQLSGLVDVSVIPSGKTIMLTTASGTALVAGNKGFQLSTQLNSSGMKQIYAQGVDITATIVAGALGGLLQARDQEIPSIQSQLDNLAAGLANAVNGVQTSGYDLDGNASTGNALFSVPPASGTGAAATMSVAISDPRLLAASSDGTAGSNANAEAMYALSSQSVINGKTPTEYYSGIVFNVGNAVADAGAEQSASDLLLKELNDQRSSVSGVSLDEEAANMLRFQQAYSASAEVVKTISRMMEDVINMKTS